MTDNLEERIGYFNQDGRRHMPSVDINGQPYQYPGNWVHLDANTFVVVPVNFRIWALIEGLKAQVGKPKAKPAKEKSDDGE